jgi:xanthine dehydrogenase YagS FAD-binding subunit
LLYELPEFEYFEPKSLDEALEILRKYGSAAKILAGGTDLLGLMKDRIHGAKMPIPSALVNIKRIEDLRSIDHRKHESTVGSSVTLTEICADPTLAERFPALVQAAKSVATTQIRNVGSLGGNLCQRPWCWYFRHPAYNCFKKGGQQCYAITGDNSTYFSVFNIGTCVMTHPSDTAPALISLDSKVTIASEENGVREIDLADFFLGPKSVQDNILKADEILVKARIPRRSPDERSVYLKHRPREDWDFALASVAARGRLDSNGNVSSVCVVLGGVAPTPFKLDQIEEMLVGKRWNDVEKSKIDNLLSKRARPLRMNRYKVRIIKALVNRALDYVLSDSLEAKILS